MDNNLKSLSQTDLEHLVLTFLQDLVDDARAYDEDVLEETREARDAFVLLVNKHKARVDKLEKKVLKVLLGNPPKLAKDDDMESGSCWQPH